MLIFNLEPNLEWKVPDGPDSLTLLIYKEHHASMQKTASG